MNVRVAAARAIAALLRQEGSLATVLPPLADKVLERDRALLQEICFGTARWYPRLALILTRLLQKPLRDKDLDVQALLACGLYQLEFMNTPSHAVLNESVAAASSLRKVWAKGLVNAVLRNAQRRRDELHSALATDPEFSSAHPLWLLKQLQQDWPQQWQAIVSGNNERPPLCLRVNRRLNSREQALQRLSASGLEARPAAWSEDGVYLARPVRVDELSGFSEGQLSVQDEAAQLAALLLDPQPGEQILDACAAPGGKTCHLLERQPAIGRLIALDSDVNRLERVQQNLDRLQLEATLIAAEAQDLDSWWDGQAFDRILLDAPCSATGVIRRHPDIKLLRRATDIPSLAQLQGELLQRLWQTLKPGGRLLYATCSVLAAENDTVIEQFLKHQLDACSQSLDAVWGDVDWGLATTWGRQLLPTEDSHDGFYYALLHKQDVSATNQATS